ncbi:enoyl-CoA hydratase/isomerase family protein [Actinophytocola sp.]|uniref:enoyl-CoA hydratase/isomerase family protein n=1 Tax=Actinophytocola sp. TaxID=1872138 RepID=UPI0025C5912E|nr:enoyl-CoA hydratase/isomerase family protein [Actinophytocola sp.]
MSGYELRRDGAVVRFVLRRPEVRNALTPEILRALERTAREVGEDRETRVLVVEAGPGEPFSSGFDFAALRELTGRESEVDDMLRATATALEETPVPVVVAISRYCYGAALELVLACDLRLAAAGSRFALPIAAIGRIYPVDGMLRLIRAVGASGAVRLQLAAEPIDVRRALAWGLVHDIAPVNQLGARVDELVGSLLRSSPNALAEIKRMMRALQVGMAEDLPRLRVVEDVYRSAVARLRASGDFDEGVAAFIDKRPPSWAV